MSTHPSLIALALTIATVGSARADGNRRTSVGFGVTVADAFMPRLTIEHRGWAVMATTRVDLPDPFDDTTCDNCTYPTRAEHVRTRLGLSRNIWVDADPVERGHVGAELGVAAGYAVSASSQWSPDEAWPSFTETRGQHFTLGVRFAPGIRAGSFALNVVLEAGAGVRRDRIDVTTQPGTASSSQLRPTVTGSLGLEVAVRF